MPGPGKIMLECVGLTRMASITLRRSTPLRSANSDHSSMKASVVARKLFSMILAVSDSIGRSSTVRG